MTRKCSVNACRSLKVKPNTPLFKAPVHSFDAWNEFVAKVNGDDNRKVTFVCAEHFTSEDLITSYVSLPKDVEDSVGKRDRCGLRKGAVPTVFKSCVVAADKNDATTVLPKSPATDKPEDMPVQLPEKPLAYELLHKDKCTNPSSQELLESFKKILFPIGWMLYSDGNTMLMYKPVKTVIGCIRMVIEKQIVFQSNTLHIDYYVNQKRVSPDILGLKQLTYPLDVTEVTNTVRMFDYLRICAGGPSIIDFPGVIVKKTHLEDTIWRHNDCPIVSPYSKKRCKRCSSLIQYFPVCKKRSLQNNKTSTECDKQHKISKKLKVLKVTKLSDTL